MRDDLTLVSDTLHGDVYSFEELVLRYESGILKFVYNMTGSREIAEEITQDVFVTIYNKLYSFNRESKFSTWLYKIARNKCIDHLRKRKRNVEVCIDDLQITSHEMSPDSYVLYKETKNNIKAFLKSLKELDREILIIRYSQEHMTFQDIGELLRMGESAVKKRYYKIYSRFEKYVEENQGVPCNLVEDFR